MLRLRLVIAFVIRQVGLILRVIVEFLCVFRQLELFHELYLMRDFEKSENVLYEKLEEKSTEKMNMDKQVTVACLAGFVSMEIMTLLDR